MRTALDIAKALLSQATCSACQSTNTFTSHLLSLSVNQHAQNIQSQCSRWS